MSDEAQEREPTLRDVLRAVGELREELGEVRIGLGDVRGEQIKQGRRLDGIEGRMDGLTGRMDRFEGRMDGLTGELEIPGREVRRQAADLPAQIITGVVSGIERTTFVTKLRALQTEVADLKVDVAELKRAAGDRACRPCVERTSIRPKVVSTRHP